MMPEEHLTISVRVRLVHLGWFWFCALALAADPLDNWPWRNPLPQGNTLNRVVFANNRFAAVGGHGALLTSPDVYSWTDGLTHATHDLIGIAFGSGSFADGGLVSGTFFISP
jgi:hypothetical protein